MYKDNSEIEENEKMDLMDFTYSTTPNIENEVCFPDFTKRITSIRETFEECGILLARDKAGTPC